MTKELQKRSRYRNKFSKDKSQTSRENYKIHRNLCKKLLRKTKKSYFESLNTKKNPRIIEPSGKLLFLFSQRRCQKVKRLSLMKQKTFLIIKKYAQFLNVLLFKPCLRLKNT